MNAVFWAGLLLVGVLSLLMPLLLGPLLIRFSIIDVPNERSSHHVITPRGGGIAPLSALIVGGGLMAVGLSASADQDLFVIVLATAVSTGALGLVEDAKGLPIIVRATVQLLIGAIFATILTQINDAPWILVPLAALAFAAYVNFANFMDGINGISGLNGLAVGLLYSFAGLIYDAPWLGGLGLATALAFSGFLPWNLRRPGLFLGDVGSYLLGAVVAASALSALYAGIPTLAALAPLSIYVFDTVATLAKRIFMKENWHTPHRQHVYQRLVDRGWSHVATASLVAVFTVVSGIIGFVFPDGSRLLWFIGCMLLVGLGIFYLALPWLTRTRVVRSS